MKIIMFYHSLVSDWNNGDAHFLRGIASDLVKQGNEVEVWEPEDSWSRMNLVSDFGNEILIEFYNFYPLLKSHFYREHNGDIEWIVKNADVVIVHEWNTHSLVHKAGEYKKKYGYKLFFHDTHHRTVTEPGKMSEYILSEYDGVIAFGKVIRDIYIKNGWTKNAWTIHEAADTKVFYPRSSENKEGDIVWIGNWGDDERSDEIREFLIEPVKELNLSCTIYGVRYPDDALQELNKAGIEYRGWLPNYKVPEVFSKYKITIHIPRGPYVKALPGIPTIRPFEAMACGIPLLSAPWSDSENLFNPGKDFLFAQSGKDMKHLIKEVLTDQDLSRQLSSSGLKTIKEKHTCTHRVNQLNTIFEETGVNKTLINNS